MLLSAVMELFSLGALYPFLAIVSDSEASEKNYFVSKILTATNIDSTTEIAYLMAAIFSVTSLLSGLLRIISIKYQIKTSHSIGVILGSEIFRRTLLQPYLTQINKNTSEVIGGIISKSNHLIMSGIYPLLVLVNSLVFFIAIITTLLIADARVSILSIMVFGSAYYLIMMVNKKRLALDSKIVAKEGDRVIKILQESFGGIRDVIIDKSEELYLNAYQKSSRNLQTSIASIQILSSIPRYIVESLGMIFIALLTCILISNATSHVEVIPVLGLLALAAQRMLPLLQQAYSAWSSIVGGSSSFNDALKLLSQPVPINKDTPNNPLIFKSEIRLENINFSYGDCGKFRLRNVSLSIKKGSKIGLMGTTGGGKSTLVDCIMGLLPPNSGSLMVDGLEITSENCSNWQTNIAHVPQAIFLADASILENIACGVPKEKIDIKRVMWAAQNAHILDVIESMENGLNEVVGERGVKLSGGQRQRIGIARALYKKSNLIVLDEATSALDSETEKNVMRSIGNLNNEVTMIIVTHRLETLKNCSEIIEMHNGEIINIGSYEKIISNALSKHNLVK